MDINTSRCKYSHQDPGQETKHKRGRKSWRAPSLIPEQTGPPKPNLGPLGLLLYLSQDRVLIYYLMQRLCVVLGDYLFRASGQKGI